MSSGTSEKLYEIVMLILLVTRLYVYNNTMCMCFSLQEDSSPHYMMDNSLYLQKIYMELRDVMFCISEQLYSIQFF